MMVTASAPPPAPSLPRRRSTSRVPCVTGTRQRGQGSGPAEGLGARLLSQCRPHCPGVLRAQQCSSQDPALLCSRCKPSPQPSLHTHPMENNPASRSPSHWGPDLVLHSASCCPATLASRVTGTHCGLPLRPGRTDPRCPQGPLPPFTQGQPGSPAQPADLPTALATAWHRRRPTVCGTSQTPRTNTGSTHTGHLEAPIHRGRRWKGCQGLGRGCCVMGAAFSWG